MKLSQLIIGLFLFHTCLAKLPKSIKICSRNNPKLNECIIESVKELQPKLATGVLDPEFVVPALEPLKLETIRMDRGKEFKAKFSQLLVTGPSNFKIEKLKVNLNNGTSFNFIISLPKLEFTGKYTLKMRILVFDIAGNGDMRGFFENSRGRVEMKANKYTKDGQTYLRFEKIKLKINIGKRLLELKNLFNGDPNLEKFSNDFINENSELFLGEILPQLEDNLADIFTSTANEIMATATYDEMFPEVQPN